MMCVGVGGREAKREQHPAEYKLTDNPVLIILQRPRRARRAVRRGPAEAVLVPLLPAFPLALPTALVVVVRRRGR